VRLPQEHGDPGDHRRPADVVLNDADVTFLTDTDPHHAQAVDMSGTPT
jgi:uncharacterized protein (DUF305 family)